MGQRIHPLAAAIALAFSSAAWQQAGAQTTLNEVVVAAGKLPEATSPRQVGTAEIAAKHAITRDTAALLQDVPGVSLYGAGGVSSLPVIHGLADDRLRVTVDGMDFIASCPNHMNPPLSYVDPTNVSKIKVYAGITPVSVGGDSIGGSIVAETRAPVFAAPGQGMLTNGEIGAFARSNNNALGGNVGATLATENFSVSYQGTTARADNYQAGRNFKTAAQNDTSFYGTGRTLRRDEVASTSYEAWTHLLSLAVMSGNHLLEAKLGYQDVPSQLYPNQRMDMLDNEQKRGSLRYLGQFDWGSADLRAYHEEVDHFMEFGEDKMFLYTAGNTSQGMPMRTASKTTGVSGKFDIELTPADLLRVGAEYRRYRLNDWWPSVAGSMGMGPNDFININDGSRTRTGIFGEWEKRLNPQWQTLVGLRYELVNSEAGMVHGYNTAVAPTAIVGMDMMNQKRDAVAFNNADRSRTDHNVDLTAQARYTADASRDVEFGFARKVRSPNLYERYTWSTASMMSIMNNFAGDGNGYVGNPDLKPETAYTAALTFDWHAPDRQWELKATPYYTHVDDYIDAVRQPSVVNMMTGLSDNNATTSNRFVRLKFANQSARLYGLDLSGRLPLAKTELGQFGLKGLLNYTRGENRDTGGQLYNIMPLNMKLALTQQLGGWNNAIEFVAVRGKHDVSTVRNEIETGGYTLTHLRGSYSWKYVRVDFGVENLFDKFYYLPLGGAYTGQGRTMGINATDWGIAVPGMGRSFYAGLNVKF